MNRLEPLMKNANQRSPEKNMSLLLEKLKPQIVPEPNKYYTFVYKAKTPNIQYDQHPAILCGSVYKWGFNGQNIHWDDIRQYTWAEVLSNIYELNEDEFALMADYPTAKMRMT